MAGNGHAGLAGGPSGDLYVGISVEPAEEFDRRGQDLFTVLDVSMTQATLGCRARDRGARRPERISVEPGTESGTVVRIKGGGVPNLNRRGRGDLYVTFHVVTPGGLSREERKLWERLAELRGERTSKREPGARPASSGVLRVDARGGWVVMDTSCLFCRIAAREIPADIVRESDRVVAFRDVNPQAPTHILLIPKGARDVRRRPGRSSR